MMRLLVAVVLIAGTQIITAPQQNSAPSAVWKATLTSSGGVVSVFRLHVAQGRQGQQLELLGSAPGQRLVVSSIHYVGANVSLELQGPSKLECSMTSVAGRGYSGTCRDATAAIQDFTLQPPSAGLLLPEHEVLLARDAAPGNLKDSVSIFVLGEREYWEASRGTAPFTCFVERPTVRDAWPICHNREAGGLLRVEQLRVRLRAAGMAETAIDDSIVEGYRRGRFGIPTPGSFGYMLSRFAWTYDNESHQAVFLSPHVHIYTPYATNEQLGVDLKRPRVPLRVEREGRADASLVIGVRVDTLSSHP